MEFCAYLRGARRRDAPAPHCRVVRWRGGVDCPAHIRNGNHSPGCHEASGGARRGRPGAQPQSGTRTPLGIRTNTAGRGAAFPRRDRATVGSRTPKIEKGRGNMIRSPSSSRAAGRAPVSSLASSALARLRGQLVCRVSCGPSKGLHQGISYNTGSHGCRFRVDWLWKDASLPQRRMLSSGLGHPAEEG